MMNACENFLVLVGWGGLLLYSKRVPENTFLVIPREKSEERYSCASD